MVDLSKTQLSLNNLCTSYSRMVQKVCDASHKSLDAAFTPILPGGSEKLIVFATRSLHKEEINYSQTEKEAPAVLDEVTKYHMYWYGRQSLKLIIGHKPTTCYFRSNDRIT